MGQQRLTTAEFCAILRAIHQTLDGDPKILNDPVAARLVDLNNDMTKEFIARRTEIIPAHLRSCLRGLFVMRSRYTEDCLAESMVRGVQQYVLLGAGFDTFAYRQPPWAKSLKLFEVDLTTTQEVKRARLRSANIAVPVNLRFVPVDFEKEPVRDALSHAGFDFGVPSFFSWLGVTEYLTKSAIEQTLRFVLSLPSASEIAIGFAPPDDALPRDEAPVLAAVLAGFAVMGEAWLTRFTPEQLTKDLMAMGFSQVVHLSPEAARQRYFARRSDDLGVLTWEQIMRAIV